jgi:sensor histidine kinase YesM
VIFSPYRHFALQFAGSVIYRGDSLNLRAMENVRGLLFRYRIWWHIIFWIVWYFFYIITYSQGEPFQKTQFIYNLYLLPVRMAAAYSLIYWILPKFLFTKKYLIFFVITIFHGILFGLAVTYTLAFASKSPVVEMVPYIRPLVLNYQIPATAVAIYMFKRWYLIQQITLNLQNEKLESELKLLKSQIHPHFLFNTLNNLYALTLKKSDKAPDMVIQLSNLLEYSLYSGKEPEVELAEEIKQLCSYIDLEKLRYGKRLDIKTKMTENTDGLMIAPLLLLPFVENSFKHGASNDIESPFIHIKMDINNEKLFFNVRNSYKPVVGKPENYKEGIGLNNVRRRLELLYPGKHKLEITKGDNVFEVHLVMDLRHDVLKTEK